MGRFSRQSLIMLLAVLVFVTGCSKEAAKVKSTGKSAAVNFKKTVEIINFDFRPSRMAIGKDGKIWLSRFMLDTSPQLVRYDPATKKTKIFTIKAQPNTGFFSSLKADGRYVWMGFGHNIVRFDTGQETTNIIKLPPVRHLVSSEKFQYDNLNSTLSNDTSMIDMTISDGDLWISRNYANSLTRYSITSGKFYEYKLPDAFGAPERLYADNFDNVWMTVSLSGDNSGIPESRVSNDRVGKYDVSTGTFKSFDQPAGFMAIDAQGTAWIPYEAKSTLVSIDKDGNIVSTGFKSRIASRDIMITNKAGNLILTAGSQLLVVDKDTKKILESYKLPKENVKVTVPRLPSDEPSKIVDKELGTEYKDMLFDKGDNLWILNESYQQIIILKKSN